MKPEDALTVSGVMSNARGVVMVRWMRKTNPMMIKQFIYMYLQRCTSASDSMHVMSSIKIRTQQLTNAPYPVLLTTQRVLYPQLQSE